MLVRLIAGFVTGVITLVAALAGSYWWIGFVFLLLFFASREWATLSGVSKPLLNLTLLGALAIVLAEFWFALPILLILPSLPHLYFQDPARGKAAIWSAAGVLWLAIPAALLVFLRTQYGFTALAVLLVGTILQDSLAYYSGYIFGGNTPFTPKLSPNKTWAGFFGGLVGMILTLVVGGDLMKWPLVVTVPAGVGLGLLGQAGDLSISALKRQQTIDDTGTLIPGHGGILDRTDALIFNVAVFFPLCRLVDIFDLTRASSRLVTLFS
jgi:phosphatidate cytidylyltransferase